jgi:putative transposase
MTGLMPRSFSRCRSSALSPPLAGDQSHLAREPVCDYSAHRSERRLCLFIATSFVKVLRPPLESAQYVSIKYTERLAEAGIEPSVGSIGDSYDNALAETINGLYKAEVIHRRGPWRSFEAVEFATLEWVDWFNNRRLLEPIGNIPPAEAEERYYAKLVEPALAA